MASAAALYTPEVLGLATGLARWPWQDALPLHGKARSRSCGSVVELALALGGDNRISNLGIKAQACAIGQAAAAIFAEAALGKTLAELAEAETQLRAWLAGEAPLPGWPGLEAIAVAQGYPGRHGAIMLAWEAARGVLPSA